MNIVNALLWLWWIIGSSLFVWRRIWVKSCSDFFCMSVHCRYLEHDFFEDISLICKMNYLNMCVERAVCFYFHTCNDDKENQYDKWIRLESEAMFLCSFIFLFCLLFPSGVWWLFFGILILFCVFLQLSQESTRLFHTKCKSTSSSAIKLVTKAIAFKKQKFDLKTILSLLNMSYWVLKAISSLFII